VSFRYYFVLMLMLVLALLIVVVVLLGWALLLLGLCVVFSLVCAVPAPCRRTKCRLFKFGGAMAVLSKAPLNLSMSMLAIHWMNSWSLKIGSAPNPACQTQLIHLHTSLGK